MKKYLLFTKESIGELYSVFQGDFDSLGEAFRAVYDEAYASGKLCIYKIRKSAYEEPPRLIAEGFVNGGLSSECVKPEIGSGFRVRSSGKEKNLTFVWNPV